ncbi:MAG: hypothetical protein EBY22_15010, partial [Gammaproteobacteria bacterium]|nr:hypothetical protein [Gammaproteobacteria bacterium]
KIRQAIALANSLGVNNVTIHRPDSTVVRYVINRSNSTVVSYARPFVCVIENSVRNITEEESNKEMEDDCAICASKHNMVDTCALTCGHQFGIECLTPWIDTLKNARKPPTCPCCRNKIKKIIKNRITPTVL